MSIYIKLGWAGLGGYKYKNISKLYPTFYLHAKHGPRTLNSYLQQSQDVRFQVKTALYTVHFGICALYTLYSQTETPYLTLQTLYCIDNCSVFTGNHSTEQI